ncbi:L-asparaginase 1 [Zoogloeaceae bacteirum Par-f-2]|nr:L-asparaginase 1 [Zoogloeaceae bacteirum Par-f-2]
MSRPRILVLYAGGTIGMVPSARGYRPMADFAAVLRRQLAAFAGLPAWEVVELAQPIDSANLQPAHWREIAAELVARWEEWDGFVVLHGTDTMAWSASALSFMLQGVDKPVIFSGAQIPLGQPRSDAPANLQGALALAADPRIREVAIYFGNRLLRGNRSRKVHADRLAAFESPNYLPLAEAGIGIVVHEDRLLRPRAREFRLPVFDPSAVAALTVYPGLSASVLEALLADPALRALVLCSYGVGNAPTADAPLRTLLGAAVARGVVVVNITQCATGSVVPGSYATGSALAEIGVVAGANLTLEAAFAKLHVLIACGLDAAQIRTQFCRPVCGELD